MTGWPVSHLFWHSLPVFMTPVIRLCLYILGLGCFLVPDCPRAYILTNHAAATRVVNVTNVLTGSSCNIGCIAQVPAPRAMVNIYGVDKLRSARLSPNYDNYQVNAYQLGRARRYTLRVACPTMLFLLPYVFPHQARTDHLYFTRSLAYGTSTAGGLT